MQKNRKALAGKTGTESDTVNRLEQTESYTINRLEQTESDIVNRLEQTESDTVNRLEQTESNTVNRLEQTGLESRCREWKQEQNQSDVFCRAVSSTEMGL